METQPLTGPIREQSQNENGYSEEEQAKVIEGSQVDLKQLKKRKPLVVDRQAKILTAYDTTHQTIVGLVKELQIVSNNPRHQEKIIEEIKLLRSIQEELLQCLLLEQKGELSEEKASQDVWNLIK